MCILILFGRQTEGTEKQTLYLLTISNGAKLELGTQNSCWIPHMFGRDSSCHLLAPMAHTSREMVSGTEVRINQFEMGSWYCK